MAKRGRKGTYVTKSDLINEYWTKHEDTLKKIFPEKIDKKTGQVISSKKIFTDTAKNAIEQSSWHSKKAANREMDDLVFARSHSPQETELRKAKQMAELPNEPEFINKKGKLDVRTLNKKMDPTMIPTDIDLGNNRYYDAYDVHETIVGYWEIQGSDFVLCKVIGKTADDSEFVSYKYERKSLLGVK